MPLSHAGSAAAGSPQHILSATALILSSVPAARLVQLCNSVIL